MKTLFLTAAFVFFAAPALADGFVVPKILSPNTPFSAAPTVSQESTSLALFGIPIGYQLRYEDALAKKYDCINVPSTSPVARRGDTVPATKPGQDWCMTVDAITYSPANYSVQKVLFSQDLNGSFHDMSAEVNLTTKRIDTLKIYTFGAEYQEKDLALLVQKFGKPDSVDRPVMQNKFGATTVGLSAKWTFPDGATLALNSGLSRYNFGTLTAKSGELNKTLATKAAVQVAAERPL